VWLALPSRQYAAKDGRLKYETTIELSDSLKARASAVALEAWEREVANG
jgi:hypothetical protein